MKKQVLFIHSAGPQVDQQGSYGLVEFLHKELSAEYHIVSPKMPDPENPKYMLWKEKLEKEIANIDGEVILIGHSLGGAVLLKYLSEEIWKLPISGLITIAAPYWGLDEEWQRDDFTLSVNFASKLPKIEQIFLYHSSGDKIVPFSHLKYYTEKLPQATVRAINGESHLFNQGLSGIIEDIENLFDS